MGIVRRRQRCEYRDCRYVLVVLNFADGTVAYLSGSKLGMSRLMIFTIGPYHFAANLCVLS